LESFAGFIEGTEPRRPEEHHGVFDTLAPEARHGLGVLGHHAEDAAVGRIDKLAVLVSEGCSFKLFRLWS
jgi:hypothetical protein